MNIFRKMSILLLLSGSVRAASPQQPATPQTVDQSGAIESLHLPDEQQTTITATSDEREGLIHLDAAARDQEGRSLGTLSATDLNLLQDGTATRILSFRRSSSSDEEERLNEVCLVLDEVDLSPVQFALVKNETINYLRRNGGVLAQPVSILWIRTDGVYTSAFPTTDGLMLAADIASNRAFPTVWKFHSVPQPGATLQIFSTVQSGVSPPPGVSVRDALWNEVLRSVYALAVKWKDKPGRKALVWIGYGWSILGGLDAKGGPFPVLVELSTRIRQARMVIYNITPWPDPEIPVHDKIPAIDYRQYISGVRSAAEPGLKSPVPYFALPVLAVRSGGLVLGNSQNVEGDIERCVVDARDFYTVSFDPPRAVQPDEYHDLAVLIGTAQLETRTSHGYYNQPVFYDEPRLAEKRLGVAEAQQLLEADRGEHDRELARTLNGLELTERLGAGPLALWKERLHGREAKSALTALGDASVFLAPPAAEVPNEPAPDDDMQRQITLRAEKYLNEVVPRLPDFSADATTIKYEQPPPGVKETWKTAPSNRALIQTISEQATLLYRNGREQRIVEKQAGKRAAGQNDLNYKGIFGPILRFVLEDVQRGNSKLTWTRWERTDQGTLAVFRYSVRAENPRYGVVYCCLVGGQLFTTLPEHHGELAIDPDTGAILRITVESDPGWIRQIDLTPLRPVVFSNMMVEYGPVDIGGRSFICPKRSVVITRERTVRAVSFWGLNFEVYGPYQTLMNDTAYRNYHKFGSESRMLPGFEVVQDGKTRPSGKDHPSAAQ
jgi:VWFA-related protein